MPTRGCVARSRCFSAVQCDCECAVLSVVLHAFFGNLSEGVPRAFFGVFQRGLAGRGGAKKNYLKFFVMRMRFVNERREIAIAFFKAGGRGWTCLVLKVRGFFLCVRAVFSRCNAIVNALFWVLFYTRFTGVFAGVAARVLRRGFFRFRAILPPPRKRVGDIPIRARQKNLKAFLKRGLFARQK